MTDKDYITQIEKLKLKLKMMEISFEQINNSRNDMIKQLAECETKLNEGCRFCNIYETTQGLIKKDLLLD